MHKSKFKTLILSMIPGAGHLYLGNSTRGLLFLFSFIGYLLIANLTSSYYPAYYYGNIGTNYSEIVFFATAVLWIYSIYDVFRIKGIIDAGKEYNSEDLHSGENKKTLALILCLVPGLGHIYMEDKEKGCRILSLFFLIYLINSIIPLPLFSLILVLVILYSIINISEYGRNYERKDNSEKAVSVFKNSYMLYIGIIFILCGIFIIGNRIAIEFIDTRLLRQFYSYLREGIMSMLLIFIGVKLILSNKIRKKV